MIRNKFSVYRWFVFLLLVLQANYFVLAQSRRIKLDEIFVLQSGESAETGDAKLKIRLSTVGREISESGEVEYIELQVRFNKSERLLTISERKNRTAIVGNFTIRLVNAESFGKTHCQLKVSRKN